MDTAPQPDGGWKGPIKVLLLLFALWLVVEVGSIIILGSRANKTFAPAGAQPSGKEAPKQTVR
jgi:hypothetical protein